MGRIIKVRHGLLTLQTTSIQQALKALGRCLRMTKGHVEVRVIPGRKERLQRRFEDAKVFSDFWGED